MSSKCFQPFVILCKDFPVILFWNTIPIYVLSRKLREDDVMSDDHLKDFRPQIPKTLLRIILHTFPQWKIACLDLFVIIRTIYNFCCNILYLIIYFSYKYHKGGEIMTDCNFALIMISSIISGLYKGKKALSSRWIYKWTWTFLPFVLTKLTSN